MTPVIACEIGSSSHSIEKARPKGAKYKNVAPFFQLDTERTDYPFFLLDVIREIRVR
jgi:hypothetical protein